MKWIVAAVIIWGAWVALRRKPKSSMPADEAAARRALGVGPCADEEAIRAAHRRQVADAHPDRGGSLDDARTLNAARDVLLGRRD